MQLSYNLIEGNKALVGRGRTIKTSYIKKLNDKKDTFKEIDSKEVITYYKDIANDILKEAQKNREKMLVDVIQEAKEIEKKAYENGYNQGFKNGIEDAVKEVEENIIPNANKEAEKIIEKARRILISANNEYENYLIDKKEEIINLSIKIAEEILKKKIELDDGVVNIVENAIKGAKGEKSLLIRANKEDIPKLEKHIKKWQSSKRIREGIFLLEYNIKQGNVIIEKENGVIEAGIEVGIQKIEEAIRG